MSSGNTSLRGALLQAFCESSTRRIIPPREIRARFPDFTSFGLHCIEAGEKVCIWRVYTPLSARADLQTVRHIRQAHQRSQRLPRESSFRELVAAGNYGFAVLLNEHKRAEYLRELLAERPLPPEVAVLVECFDVYPRISGVV